MVTSCLVASNLIQAQQLAPSSACSELFISELVLNKHFDASGALKPDYAIEIYNPSASAISLSTYTLEFTSSNGTVLTVPFTPTTLDGGKCLVIADFAATLGMRNLAQQLVSSLDFSTRLSVALKKGTTVIDQVGETITGGTFTSFDPIAFAADPAKYLSTIDLNLNEIEGIAIRRGVFVTEGTSTFSASAMLGKWSLAYGSDYSDLGTHKSNCWPSALGSELFVEWLENDVQFCMTDPTNGPISTNSNDALYFVVSANWPMGCGLDVTYKPSFVSTGPLTSAPNILFDNLAGTTYPGDAALGFYPNVPAGCTVATTATTLVEPVVNQLRVPALTQNGWWLITAQPLTSTVNAGYFPYTYTFSLDGNIALASTIPCTGYSVNIGAKYEHKTIVKANDDACGSGPYTVAIDAEKHSLNSVQILQHHNMIDIVSKGDLLSLLIIDQQGRTIMKSDCKGNSAQIPTSDLGVGIMYLTIKTTNGAHARKLFVF
jgi:hypothetical protein